MTKGGIIRIAVKRVAAKATPNGLVFLWEGLQPRTFVFEPAKVAAEAAPTKTSIFLEEELSAPNLSSSMERGSRRKPLLRALTLL